MKVEITKRCSVICEPGSIVEVTEGQLKALCDFCKPVAEKTVEAAPKKTTPKGGKKKEV